MHFSSLLSSFNEILEHGLFHLSEKEAMVTVRSIDYKSKDGETIMNISCKKRDLDNVDEYDDMGNLLIRESIYFKKLKKLPKLKLQTTVSFRNLAINGKNLDLFNRVETTICSLESKNSFSPRPTSEIDGATTKLLKAFKGYQTPRNLTKCAIVAEEQWWKELDFAALQQSSISFFSSGRSETAVSRWARATTRAAKVGKGLSKDKKAKILALRHWLEAIDPLHRYGSNLYLYYDVWFGSESPQPFFYWLDVGEGKEVSLDTCSRSELESQCVKYLGPKEREAYEVIVKKGKLIYRQSGMPVDTVEGTKCIFVLSASRNLYVGQKKKGLFQHSSFLAGGAAIAAGRLVAHCGVLKTIWSYSGHYRPTEENFMEFITFLEKQQVDLTNVKKCPMDDGIPPARDISHINADVGAIGPSRPLSIPTDHREENIAALAFELGKPL